MQPRALSMPPVAAQLEGSRSSQIRIDQYGSVQTVQYPGPRHFTSRAGLGPQEERLVLALVGGLAAALAGLALIVACCRQFKLSGLAAARRAKWRRRQRQFFMPGQVQRPAAWHPGFRYPNLLSLGAAAPAIGAWNHFPVQPLCVVNSAAVTSSTATTETHTGNASLFGTGIGCGLGTGAQIGSKAVSRLQSEFMTESGTVSGSERRTGTGSGLVMGAESRNGTRSDAAGRDTMKRIDHFGKQQQQQQRHFKCRRQLLIRQAAVSVSSSTVI